jgi:putative FmdB family regulatory protein
MPIYEFKCANGHLFEVMLRMSDDPPAGCEVCGAPIERVFHPIAVHFKGSGFYNTDYGTRKRAREKAAESSSTSETKSETKSDAKSESKSKSSDTSSPAKAASSSD